MSGSQLVSSFIVSVKIKMVERFTAMIMTVYRSTKAPALQMVQRLMYISCCVSCFVMSSLFFIICCSLFLYYWALSSLIRFSDCR